MPYGMASRDFQGDPFLGGVLKGIAGIAGRALKRAIPGVGVISELPGLFRGKKPPTIPFRPGLPRLPATDPRVQLLTPAEPKNGKRRRINPANPKALRRAIRRQDGFVKLARRALKGSGYTIVSRGSRRPKRDLPAGHMHVR